MDKVELIFEEPPESPRSGRPSKYLPWLNKLTQHPNVWAKYPIEVVNPSGAASALRKNKQMPPGFEVVGRCPIPGRKKGYVYARYVGGPK